MKKRNIILVLMGSLLILSGCFEDFLNQSVNTQRTYDQIIGQGFGNLYSNGMAAYSYLREFTSYNSNTMLAGACDEADFANKASTIQRFNTGGWNQFSNPDEVMTWYYRGIVQTHNFIKNSEEFRHLLVVDTLTLADKEGYLRQCDLMYKLRAENRFLRAWFYFELLRRYGGVPIIEEPLDVNTSDLPPRNTVDEVVDYILDELDAAYPDMVDHWLNYNIPDGVNSVIGSGRGDVAGSTDVSNLGKAERVAVKALRLRVLLYAASPLFNPGGDVAKWEAAAAAGHDFLTDANMNYWKYLSTNYANLFVMKDQNWLTSRKGSNTGIIFTVAQTVGGFQTTIMEQWNYPVGISGGGTNVCAPSQNLVDAFEVRTDANTAVPFDWNNAAHVQNIYNTSATYPNRDPRLKMIVGVNGDILGKSVGGANRAIQSYVGGPDAIGAKEGATTTGYYLKKMINTDFDLSTAAGAKRSFILMRYAEVLLNYAEAMNEAYPTPDDKPTINGTPAVYSAREAVNLVRARTGVAMPPLPLGLTKTEMREKIRNERRIELAFEEHRFFDVRRWKIAETTENDDLMGIRVVPVDPPANTTFTYTPFKVESRTFDATNDKMYLYPIPEAQVIINNWQQNPGW